MATRRIERPAKHIEELPEAQQAEIATAVPQGWVEEAVGFPPYWKPTLGGYFKGIVLMRDERDPSFIRYHIEARMPLDCRTGKADDGEVVAVKTGEVFTTSAFAALPLDRFFGFEVFVQVTQTRKLPGNDQSDNVERDMWVFKVMVSPETKKLLDDGRRENIAYLKEMRAAASKKAIENMMLLNSNGAKGSKSANAAP